LKFTPRKKEKVITLMNAKFVCLALVTTLFAACNRSEVPVQPTAAPAAEPVAATPAIPQGDAILINGYVPAFPHKVRSMRDDGDKHFVVLEYLGVDRDAAISAISDSLTGEGFRVVGPQPRDAAVQYVYIDADGRRMSGIFSDPSSKPLMNADAEGIAMFSWTDAAAD
jgi:hypothetical protein